MSELPASRQLLNRVVELQAEIERLRADLQECNEARQRFKDDAYQRRFNCNAIIEECARVVDNFGMDEALSYGLDGIAAAIRALKDKP